MWFDDSEVMVRVMPHADSVFCPHRSSHTVHTPLYIHCYSLLVLFVVKVV